MEDRRFLSSICALLGTPTRCPLLHGVFCRFEGTRRVKDPVVSTALCARGSALEALRSPTGEPPTSPAAYIPLYPTAFADFRGPPPETTPSCSLARLLACLLTRLLACSLAHPIPHRAFAHSPPIKYHNTQQ